MYYSGCNKKSLNYLQSLQNRAIRIICKMKKRTNTDNKLLELGLSKIEDIQLLAILNYGFEKSFNDGLLDTRVLPTRSHIPVRRQLCENHSTINAFRKSFIYKSTQYWNNLHNDYHNCINKNEFKCLLQVNWAEVKRKLKIGIG